jgi:Tfp pilus assembly protein FimV
MVALRIAAAFLLAGVPGPAASAAAESIRVESGHAVPGGDRIVVNVQPGQTVSMIIRQHYRDSPFNERFVGRVLAEMNPGAFVRGSPHRLVAGTRLVLPSMQELAGSMAAAPVAPEPIAMRMPTAPAPIEPVQAGVEARVEVRPRWIRYP